MWEAAFQHLTGIHAMLAFELTINGTGYQYRQLILKEDRLWECAYVDVHGSEAEVETGKLVSYDESLGRAKAELEQLAKDNGLEANTDNKIILLKHLDPETQRKTLVLARKIMYEEESRWHSFNEDFQRWRQRMYDYTGIWFTKSQYNNLTK